MNKGKTNIYIARQDDLIQTNRDVLILTNPKNREGGGGGGGGGGRDFTHR